MRLRITPIILYNLMALFFLHNSALSYDDKRTHPDITRTAVEISNLNIYLMDNLGFSNGIDTQLPANTNNTVNFLLQKGAELEDLEPCRRANHMHNPMNWISWNDSYMSDDPWWVTFGCSSWGRKYSNVTWATGYLSPAPEGTKESYTMAPQYAPNNWDRAREYYYNAIISQTSAAREAAFTQTFQSVGQVMHLLQDMAVPAHTRNDFASHLIQNGLLITGVYQPYERYVRRNPSLVATAQGIQTPSFTFTSLTQFWDTNTYFGNNPSQDWSQGLSEFTNANYFSDSTIPTNNPISEHSFFDPHITTTGYQICEEYVPGPTTESRKYVSRKNKPGCDHFAAVSMLNPMMYMSDINYLNANIANLKLALDDSVHNTYAKELLPRAVGYSTALLNYFFRGTIEISLPDDGIYAITGPGGTFSKIKLKAVNTTANDEAMTGGTIQLVVKYKTALTDPFQIQTGCMAKTADFSFAVASASGDITSLPTGTPTTLTFNLDPGIPLEATDVYLQVVYKGQLGNEADAVAVGFKDIAEPAPHTIANNTDFTCVNGVNLPSVIPTSLVNMNLAFTTLDAPQYASSTNHHAHFASIPPGSYGRVYILTAYDIYTYSRQADNHPLSQLASYVGLSNQGVNTSDCTYPDASNMSLDRGVAIWSGTNFHNNPIPADSVCPSFETPLSGPVSVTINQ